MAQTLREEKRERTPRVSWGAIFAGGLTALTVSSLLILLGIGFGFTTIDPLTESNPLSGLGTGSIIWWTISNLIALFLGGMVASRLAGFISETDGGLHGFLSWGVYAIVSMFFVASLIGSVIAGVTGTVSSIFGGGEQKVVVEVDNQQQQQNQSQQNPFRNLEDEVFQLINTAEKYNILPSSISNDVKQSLNEGMADMRQMWQDEDLDRNIEQFFNDISIEFDENENLDVSVEGDFINQKELKQYLTENTDLSEQEIDQTINEWNQNIDQAITKVEDLYREAKQKIEEYSDELADNLATFSLVSFFVFLLGAIAAYSGGFIAAKKYPDIVVEEDYPARK